MHYEIHSITCMLTLTLSINLSLSGRAPSRTSCIMSGMSAPEATLKYVNEFSIERRLTPYTKEKCCWSARERSFLSNTSQWYECCSSDRRVNWDSTNWGVWKENCTYTAKEISLAAVILLPQVGNFHQARQVWGEFTSNIDAGKQGIPHLRSA